jgi:transposase
VANQYLVSNRDQLYLLPPAMVDWLPENHLVWFVLDVVNAIDRAPFHARRVRSGPGRPAYHPDQMLALLIYAYANGVRSSRQIERLCSSDVAYRVISADHRPDHATIARFRGDHEEAFKQVFVDVLRLCAAAGLASLGTVSIDGTKIEANGAMSANRQAEAIRAEVERILKEAEMIDGEEQTLFGSSTGRELPAHLARRSSRLSHLRAAQAELAVQQTTAEARAVEATAAAREAAEKGRMLRGRRPSEDPYVERERARIEVEVARQRAAEPTKAEAKGHRPPGPKPRPDAPQSRHRVLTDAEARLAAAEAAVTEAARTAKVNVTDPDSRIMSTRHGFIQGYNAQGTVNQHQVVLATAVTQQGNDFLQFVPMVNATERNARLVGLPSRIGIGLADAGYWSEANATAPGPDRLIATTKDYKQRQAARRMGLCVGPPPADASALEAMEHRMRTEEGTASYALRFQTVEPVFGTIKAALGFRRFSRRGQAAAEGEWNLVCSVHNLLKLFRHPGGPRLAAPTGVTA